jgi:hypothetical protein
MTVLNDEDINLHGISVRSLKRAGRVIGGISGFMSICIVEDVCGDFLSLGEALRFLACV